MLTTAPWFKAKVNDQFIPPKLPTDTNALLWVLGFFSIGLIIIIIGFYLSPIADPYIQEVLALKGDRQRGQAIFEINCAACHGWFADGNVGPSLHEVSKHKSKVSLIDQVISGKTPPMPKFQPNSQAMADLLSYLENL